METKPGPAANWALPSGAATREDQMALAYRTAGELLQALARDRSPPASLSTTRLRVSRRLIQRSTPSLCATSTEHAPRLTMLMLRSRAASVGRCLDCR